MALKGPTWNASGSVNLCQGLRFGLDHTKDFDPARMSKGRSKFEDDLDRLRFPLEDKPKCRGQACA